MMNKMIAQFAKDESGVTAVEYGVLAFGLVAAIGLVTASYGGFLTTAFNNIALAIK